MYRVRMAKMEGSIKISGSSTKDGRCEGDAVVVAISGERDCGGDDVALLGDGCC